MSYSLNNRYIDGDEMDDIAPLLSTKKRSEQTNNDPYFTVKRYCNHCTTVFDSTVHQYLYYHTAHYSIYYCGLIK